MTCGFYLTAITGAIVVTSRLVPVKTRVCLTAPLRTPLISYAKVNLRGTATYSLWFLDFNLSATN